MTEDRVMLGIILTMFFIGLFIYFSTMPAWLGESTIKFIKIILAENFRLTRGFHESCEISCANQK